MSPLIPPRRLVRILSVVIGALVVAHFVSYGAYVGSGRTAYFFWLHFLNLDQEKNLPTWYQTMTLVLAGFMCRRIGLEARRAGRPYGTHWLGLAVLFTYLSIDETARIHESAVPRFRAGVHAGGWPALAWVLPLAALVLILARIYLPFFAALPRRTRRLLVSAGALFALAAIGMEQVVSLLYVPARGLDNWMYQSLSAIEELGEMVAVLGVLYALTVYAIDLDDRALPATPISPAASARPQVDQTGLSPPG